MKKILILSVCLALLSNIKAQQAPDTLRLTLPQAIDIALNENPSIRINDKEIQRVEYSNKETKGVLLPSISLSSAYSRSLKKQRLVFMGREVEIGMDNSFNAGIAANLPVFAPALWESIKMGEIEMESTLEKARSSKIELVNQVTKAYYGIIMAQDSRDVIKQTYDIALENSQIIQNKYKQGTVAEFETIRADVQEKNVAANLNAAENGIDLSKLSLKMLLGIPAESEIILTEKLSDYEKKMFVDYMKIDTTDLTNNSDMKKFDILSKQLNQTLKIQKKSWLPNIYANYNYSYMSMVNDSSLFTKNHNWFPTSTAGLSLSLPLFQGGQRYYKEKQLKIQIEELKDQKIQLQRSVQLQAMSQLNNMNRAMKLIESNKVAVTQAEKAMQISKKRYEVGAGTYLDVSSSELAFMQSGLAYNQAVYDYLNAKTELEKILGKTSN